MNHLHTLEPRWFDEVRPLFFRRCGQRILVVTDGGLNYDPNDGFGLTEFLQILSSSGSLLSPPVISTAHRSGDPNASIAGAFNFATAARAVTTANYDQIWMFGISTSPLQNAERRVIAQFMQDGGGVFATGDHSTLGAGMGANLPRVRNMRNWSSIPMSSQDRHDTVAGAGKDPGYQFTDQSDDLPQRIYPHYQLQSGTWVVHPLLRSPAGDIESLPDHPHESECTVPSDLTQSMSIDGLTVQEYPADSSGTRISPVIVATSISGGRYLTDAGKPPVNPRCFGAISAYDGHRVGVGRVVCDATWHHFVNINLNGMGNPLRNPADFATGKNGLYDAAGNPTPLYQQIKRYYKNVAGWMAPSRVRWCRWWLDLVLERYRFPLIEEWEPLPHPAPWERLVQAGALVQEALDRAQGAGTAAEMVADLIGGDLSQRLFAVGKERHLMPALELRQGLLGAAMEVVARELPEDPLRLAAALKDMGADDIAREQFATARKLALGAAGEHFARAAQATARLAKALGDTEAVTAC